MLFAACKRTLFLFEKWLKQECFLLFVSCNKKPEEWSLRVGSVPVSNFIIQCRGSFHLSALHSHCAVIVTLCGLKLDAAVYISHSHRKARNDGFHFLIWHLCSSFFNRGKDSFPGFWRKEWDHMVIPSHRKAGNKSAIVSHDNTR